MSVRYHPSVKDRTVPDNNTDSVLIPQIRKIILSYVLFGAVMKDSNERQDEMVVAIVWYRPDQWQRVRDIAADADELEASYAEWLHQAEEKFKEIKSTGLRVEKVDVDSEQLILWCNERALENNGQSRSQYAAERLSELDQKRSLIQRRT
jgi:hypothetical protein